MRRLRGINAVVFCAVVVGALALTYGLLDRRALRWDFTANREFTLSDQTQKILKGLSQDVSVTAFFRMGGDLDDIFIRRRTDDILKEYAARSPRLTYRLIDPDREIEAALQHQITLDGTVVFVGPGNRRKEVYKSHLFDYGRMSEEALPEFKGESVFTNAILQVTQQKSSAICLLEGYQERDWEGDDPESIGQARQYLTKNNYDVRTVSFVTSTKVPPDCTALLVAGPRRAITGGPDRLIRDYLREGGRLLLFVDPLTPVGLAETLGALGLKLNRDVVIDPERHFLLGLHFPAPVLEPHEITRPIQQLNPILGLARSLQIPEGSEGVAPILTSTSKAWGETTLEEGTEPRQDPRDLPGPLTLGVAVTREEKPEAVVVGDSDFFSNGLIEAPGNLDLFLNMVAWAAGIEDQIAIHPKSTEFRPLSLTPGFARLVGITTQAGLPLVVLLGGGIGWFRRRRR